MSKTPKDPLVENDYDDMDKPNDLDSNEDLGNINIEIQSSNNKSSDVRRRIDDILERKKLREEFGEIDDLDF